MEPSPLRKLPPELRLGIHELVFAPARIVRLGYQHDTRHRCKELFWQIFHQPDQDKSNLLALTETCRLIRAESMPIFFQMNAFVFRPHLYFTFRNWTMTQNVIYAKSLGGVKRWLKTIGSANAASIRSFNIETVPCDTSMLIIPTQKWWAKARKLEAKLLLHAQLQMQAIHMVVNVELMDLPYGYSWRFEDKRYRGMCSEQGFLDIRKYYNISFRISTSSKAEARRAVEEASQSQHELFGKHKGHGKCWIDSQMEGFFRALQTAYDNVNGMLGEETVEV